MRILIPQTAILLILAQVFSGCVRNQREPNISAPDELIVWQSNSHAKFFRIGTTPTDTLLEIYFDTSHVLQKFHKGQNPQQFPEYHSISTLTSKVRLAVLTSAFSNFLDLLGAIKNVIAIDQIEYWTNQSINKLPLASKTPQIQKGGNLNIEKLLKLKPDITFTYTLDSKIDHRRSKISNLVFIQNHFEVHPLAKAEWIKVFGFFLNQSSFSIEIFQNEKSRYNDLMANSKPIKRPKIMVNLPYSGIWWVPQKYNYLTQLIIDAGGDPIWIAPTLSGSNSAQISTEQGLSFIYQCDILLHPGSIKNLNEISDTRISKTIFSQNPEVWQNDLKMESTGANSFWDIGSAQPHRLLKDLQLIFYQQGRNTYFYRKINR